MNPEFQSSSAYPRRKAVETVATCAFFLAALFTPLALSGAGLGRDDRILSQSEYRKPSPRPAFPLGIAEGMRFPWQWDDYWRDAFPYRGPLIRVQAHVRHRTLGANGLESIFLEDGYVFGLAHIDRYRGKIMLRDGEIDRFLEIIRLKREFFRKAGISYYFVMAPSRLDFCRDLFRGAFRLPDRHVLSTRIDERMPEDIRKYYIVPDGAMREAQARHPERLLFYKRDCHWNEWGRTVAAAEIIRFLRAEFPALPPLDPEAVPFVSVPEDQEFWYDLRALGVAFDAFPVPMIEKTSPAWTEEYRRLQADRSRSPLTMVYASDSFMEVLSDRSPEILSFASVDRAGTWENILGAPAGCRQVLDAKPDVVLESIYIDALTTWRYLEKNAAWESAEK